jgi:hypothetical protein
VMKELNVYAIKAESNSDSRMLNNSAAITNELDFEQAIVCKVG